MNEPCANRSPRLRIEITTQTSAVVCSFSPLPAGWVVSSYYPSSNCYGSGVAHSIRKA